jgi:fatty acid desaturase
VTSAHNLPAPAPAATADHPRPAPTCPTPASWPTTRILFALAGTVTLLSATMAATLSPWFLLLTVFVGANQLLFVAVGACPVLDPADPDEI